MGDVVACVLWSPAEVGFKTHCMEDYYNGVLRLDLPQPVETVSS